MINKKKGFWNIFYQNILSEYSKNNKIDNCIIYIEDQLNNLDTAKDKLKKRLKLKLNDIDLDAIIESCIKYDNNLTRIKSEMGSKYVDFIPLINCEILKKELEELLIFIHEGNKKGFEKILKNYIELENSIENHYNQLDS